jgi:hypothetical protein
VTPTRLALMILFAIVDMAIVLALHESTFWACVSDDHHCLSAPLISVLWLTDSHTASGDEYYLYSTTPPSVKQNPQPVCYARTGGAVREAGSVRATA